MNRSLEIEVKVGIFVALGLALVMLTILLLGGGQAIFQRSVSFSTKFNQIEGLVEGATVKMSGVKIGQVQEIRLLPNTNQVQVTFAVSEKFRVAIHEDSAVGVQTQGVLGDRYIVVNGGSPSAKMAKDYAELKSETPRELKDYLNNADEVLGRLKTSLQHMESILGSFQHDNRAEIFFRNLTATSTNASDSTKNLRESTDHMKSVMTKIDNGQGTLGALVNDPALYDDLRALLGGANRNRVLKYFIKKSVEESREAAKENK